MKLSLSLLLILNVTSICVAQDNPDYLLWNSNHELTLDDFGIKKSDPSYNSFAQFTVEQYVSGLDFMTKNFNKKVKNLMIKSASWIDTTQNVQESLKYHQILFDISEVYARKLRKDLKENRKQIAKGLSIVNDLSAKNSAEFAKRRLEYDGDTEYGKNSQKLLLWDQKIKQELGELSDYDFNK